MKKKVNRKIQKGGDGAHNIQSVSMPLQYFGGELPRYFPTGSTELQPGTSAYGDIVASSFGKYVPDLTCGANEATAPNLAPYPNATKVQTGGKRSKNKSKKLKKNKKYIKKGGDGAHNIQSVGMPTQYFGGDLPRYFPAGSTELQPGTSAYGDIVASSFGKYVPDLTCGATEATAPNLAPYPNATKVQTGGKRSKKKK